MEIILSEIEILTASVVGSVRRTRSIRDLKDRHGIKPEDGFKADIIGATGELVLCKALGIYWDMSINTFKRADAWKDIQIRTSSSPNDCLIVRHQDSNLERFVLVTGCNSKWEVRGWLYGSEAKQDKWLDTKGGRPSAYFVPQLELHSIETLRQMVCGNPNLESA